MAKKKYKPYPTRKQQQNRRMRSIALVLIVLIVGIVILTKTYNQENSPPASSAETSVSLQDIQPDNTPEAPDTPEPVRIVNPAVAPRNTEPEPEPELIVSAADSQPDAPVQEQPEEPVVSSAEEPTQQETEVTVESEMIAGDTTSQEAMQLIDRAMTLRKEGKIIQARELLNNALDMPLSPAMRSAVKERLSNLADLWLFNREVLPNDTLTSYYTVQRGDLLQNIANKKKVPYQILMKINGIDRPELLQAGKPIKVIEGPFNVVVYKDSFTMDLYLQRKYVKTYSVGLGRAEYETPSGRWRVKSDGKLIKPTWTDPDTGKTYVGDNPDYPLGSRWIAIEGIDEKTKSRTGFAIHGTKDPDSIGTRSSRGCIRLYNGDAIEVYNLLYGGISEVLVMD